jgi:putative ABC transport system ATP-binding protein
MALGAQPHKEAGIIQPLPSGLTAAFTLKGVRQVKDGMTVLDGIELVIPHGAITALVGPSGAGKTSLLRLLNRLDDPVSGDILYRGRAITHYPVRELRRRVGFVFQTPVMFPGTVRENLQAALTLGGRAALHEVALRRRRRGERALRPSCVPTHASAPAEQEACADTVAPAAGRDAERRMAAAMALAELDGTLCDRDGDRLSGGQKQRVNIARALLTSPDVLLMDEPTSALDPETADRLMETTRRLSQEQHLTVVMVTHRLSEARRTSDMTVVLERGRVVAMGRTADVFGNTTNPRLRAFLDTER